MGALQALDRALCRGKLQCADSGQSNQSVVLFGMNANARYSCRLHGNAGRTCPLQSQTVEIEIRIWFNITVLGPFRSRMCRCVL